MSQAKKCDACEKFFEPRQGCISLVGEIQIVRGYDENNNVCDDTWGDEDDPFDFCLECSMRILEIIGKGLIDLDKTLTPPVGEQKGNT